MAQVIVNFRMDEELKKSMEETCAEMGLSMTAAFTIFAKKVVRDQCIPFEVSAVPQKTEAETNSRKLFTYKYRPENQKLI